MVRPLEGMRGGAVEQAVAAPLCPARLGDADVLVSDVSNQLPPGFIRVSIGTPEENDAFVASYMEVHRTYD